MLSTVIIGKRVSSLSQGVFYNSPVKDVYVKALTPPTLADYIFNSNPTIHVYESALTKYNASNWAKFGTIVGDLTDDIIDGLNDLKDSKDSKDLNDSKDLLFDLTGRRVTDTKSGSIYIQGNQKYMAK